MSNRQHGLVKSIRQLLDKEGVIYSFDKRGKHPYVTVLVPNGQFKYYFPLTPSDPRSEINALMGIRRKLRALSH